VCEAYSEGKACLKDIIAKVTNLQTHQKKIKAMFIWISVMKIPTLQSFDQHGRVISLALWDIYWHSLTTHPMAMSMIERPWI
jgi:hypothetical protein